MQGHVTIVFDGDHVQMDNRAQHVATLRRTKLKFECDVHTNDYWHTDCFFVFKRNRFKETWYIKRDASYWQKTRMHFTMGQWSSITFEVTDRRVNALGTKLPSDVCRIVARFL